MLTGCSSVVEHVVAKTVIENQEKVRSYEGTYVETGTVPGDPSKEVRGRVRFVAPSDFVLEVLSPEEYAGDTLAYVGSDLWLYSERHDLGVHVRGVPWSQERWREWVRATVDYDWEHFDYEGSDTKDTVAGRVATRWYVRPRDTKEVRGDSRVFLDDEFSTTLGLEYPGYRFRFEQVAFNRPLERPTFEAPATASFLEWDMASKPISLEEAKHYADFSLLEPAETVLGLERTRIVWATTDLVPLVALVYEKGPFYASVAETKDREMLDPRGRGIDVDLGDTRGRIAAVASMSFLTFVRKGTQVTIVSNLPFPELIRFAKSLGTS